LLLDFFFFSRDRDRLRLRLRDRVVLFFTSSPTGFSASESGFSDPFFSTDSSSFFSGSFFRSRDLDRFLRSRDLDLMFKREEKKLEKKKLNLKQ
jgi:hypothetical protein